MERRTSSTANRPDYFGNDDKRGVVECSMSVRETAMTTTSTSKSDQKSELPATHSPIVSPQEWEAAGQQMLVKEKAHMRAHDALVAERRRMPWMAVEKAYEFEGPQGKASLLDLFEGRRQLIVYRAFFEPGVHGWPEHACVGCSLGADQV
jgi:predicted dithiol-disulfide oxidoreductase (DUF899 family)